MGDAIHPIGRRMFIKSVAGAAAGYALFATVPGGGARLLAAVPGSGLVTSSIDKYVTPLLIPPVMPRAGVIKQRGGQQADYYEISVRQFAQQILPVGMPTTTVWGYGATRARDARGLLLHNAPSLTIEARHNRPVRVKWINELIAADGRYLPHLLPVDPTLHWANPAGGDTGRDTRPTFAATPGRYTGPVPLVTHVHGAVGVGDESDGYAEAWFLPAADNIPAGYATQGTWYDFFARKAAAKFGVGWGPGYAVFQYPNLGRASADWYHDHTLGMTRLNVYAGPAGFYIIRGGPGDDVRDSRTGALAVLPGPAPREGDKFPSNKAYREIPLAIQDRSFNADGSLFYPDTRAFFDGVTGPYLPETDVSPIWNPEFFGSTIIVNGNTWPVLAVEQRRYRFRVLNGCQSRFLILDFANIPGVRVWAIGNEGGFLDAPVDLGAGHGSRLLMAPAERADLIVDFAAVPLGDHVLGNIGPDGPFRGGAPGIDFPVADPAATGQVLAFRVVRASGRDDSTPPQFLRLPAAPALPNASVTRPLALLERMSMDFADAPAETLLGTMDGNPSTAPSGWTQRLWMDEITENPAPGATEVWEFYNATADAHPIHIHETAFEVVNRQEIVIDAADRVATVGPAQPPQPWETGYKDTVVAYPGEVTRVKAAFGQGGQYVWHCHIVEHEDNEMMRPFRIGPMQEGQPMPPDHHGGMGH